MKNQISIDNPQVSPQAENGYTAIANEIAEAFFTLQLSGNEWRVLWVIIRQTYGWKKKTERISISTFERKTGLKRRHIFRLLKNLIERNIITKNDTTFITTYGFQKDYSKYKPLPKMTYSVKIGNETVTKIGAHKRKERKKNIASSKIKDASLPSQEKKKDPRVKTLIDFFYQTCTERKGFKPLTNGKDAKAVQVALKTYPEDTLKEVIIFFLDSEKADKVGVTLSIAMSNHTINQFLETQAKNKTPDDYFTKVTA